MSFILDFNERFSPIKSDYNSDPIEISADELVQMFKDAQADPSKGLSDEDTAKFLKVCDFVSEAFDIRFGNRILVQIENFVPVYVALGGTKEEALDFMLVRKVLRKINGMFEDFVKDELINLKKKLDTLYGRGVFVETEKLIAKIQKRLV